MRRLAFAFVLSAVLGAAVAVALGFDASARNSISNGAGQLASSSQPAGDISGLAEADVTQLYAQVRPSVVIVFSVSSRLGSVTGSGVVLDKQGDILTNYHVVSGAGQLSIGLSDGTSVSAQIVGSDPGDDLSVLKISVSTDKLFPVKFADPNQVRTGQSVVAIGNPFDLEGSLSEGLISGIGRVLSGANARPLRQLIQTDTAINAGNSGGGLFNLNGELVGLTNAIEDPSGQGVFVGIGYAIPVDTVQKYLPAMLASKTINHPKLGISLQDLTPLIAQTLNINIKQGVLVEQVDPNSGAARAGLRGASNASGSGGDIITAIDGHEVKDFSSLADYLDSKNVGDSVKLQVIRAGSQLSLTVTLDAWSQS